MQYPKLTFLQCNMELCTNDTTAGILFLTERNGGGGAMEAMSRFMLAAISVGYRLPGPDHAPGGHLTTRRRTL